MKRIWQYVKYFVILAAITLGMTVSVHYSLFVWNFPAIFNTCTDTSIDNTSDQPPDQTTNISGDIDKYSVTVSIAEVLVAIAAASIIIVQLKQEEQIQEKQQQTAEAQFMLEYNKSFIEDKEINLIEYYLEKSMGSGSDKISGLNSLREGRHMLVNYLVYLEGMASCVHEGQLRFESIDDVFAYRFFIAVNNPEVQYLELVKFAPYYRGCFQLYDEWTRYREKARKRKRNYNIPLEETSLDKCKDFELYLEYPIDIKDKWKISIKPRWISSKIWRELSEWNKNMSVRNEASIYKFAVRKNKMIGVMRYNSYEDKIFIDVIAVESKKNNEKQTKSALLKEVLYQEAVRHVEIQNSDDSTRKLLEELKHAKEIIENVDVYKTKRQIEIMQLNQDSCISNSQLKEIAGLIYDTDVYTYSAVFDNRQNALKLIPSLIADGKDSIFCLPNIYAAMYKEKIAGVILWKKGPLQWNANALRNTAEYLGINISNHLDDVSAQYINQFNVVTAD